MMVLNDRRQYWIMNDGTRWWAMVLGDGTGKWRSPEFVLLLRITLILILLKTPEYFISRVCLLFFHFNILLQFFCVVVDLAPGFHLLLGLLFFLLMNLFPFIFFLLLFLSPSCSSPLMKPWFPSSATNSITNCVFNLLLDQCSSTLHLLVVKRVHSHMLSGGFLSENPSLHIKLMKAYRASLCQTTECWRKNDERLERLETREDWLYLRN